MREPLVVKGSAMVGWVNASGFVKLLVSPENLVLRVALLGRYTFRPDEVVSLTRVSWVPLFVWGVRIEHTIANYPKQVIFCSRDNPDALLKRIGESGFEPKAPASATPLRPGIAFRWQAIAIAFIVWSALLQLWSALLQLPRFFPASGFASPALGFPLLALLLLFYFSFRIPRSPALQRLIVSDGRHVGEIKPVLNVLAFISGLMFCVFAIVLIVLGVMDRGS